jgi:Arylsulfatase A and related enzymes
MKKPLLLLLIVFPAMLFAQRPNIVIFVADDLGITDSGPYGNKIVKTPHLDALAAESLLFNNAFANTPTCIPSRCTLLTGLLPHRNGSHANNVKGYPVSEVKPGIKTLPAYLKEAGYKVAHAGKKHFGPLSAFDFEYIANSEVREPGYENKPGLFMDLNTEVVDQWLSQQKKNKPFCLYVADNSPHVIWPEQPTYDAKDMDVPPNAIGTEAYKKMRARYYTDVTRMDRNLGNVLHALKKYGFSENTIVIFTSDQGAQFPFAKWNLYDAGVHTPLLIKWPKNIQPGTTHAVVSHIDMLPTILEMAGIKVPDGLDGTSYLPVLKGRKNSHASEIFLTHSQDGLMNITPMRGIRTDKFKYILNLSPQYAFHTHIDAARDHDGGASYWIEWEKLAKTDLLAQALTDHYYNRPKEELYDVVNDPYELDNLAYNPDYADILKDMRARLEQYRKQQQDTITGPILDIENTWKSEKR